MYTMHINLCSLTGIVCGKMAPQLYNFSEPPKDSPVDWSPAPPPRPEGCSESPVVGTVPKP